MRTKEEVDFAFTPVAQLTPSQKQYLYKIELLFKDAANDVIEYVPDSADRTSAIRKLLEAKLMCTQAITHNESPEQALIKKSVAKKGTKNVSKEATP